MKIINLEKINTECIHNNSVFKKALLKVGDIKGDIQTMNYAWLEKDMSLESHVHEDCEEYFLFLDGGGKMKIDDNEFDIQKGDFVTIEENESHSIQNTGNKNIEFISLRILSR